MRLINDERVVAAQQWVGLDLREEDAVRHEFHEGRWADLVGETHLIADDLAGLFGDSLPELCGDAVRNRAGSEPAGLGVSDHPGDASAKLEADLRQLGRLARAGFTGHDDDLVVADRGGDLIAPGGYGQIRVVDDGDRGCALGKAFRGERLEGSGSL